MFNFGKLLSSKLTHLVLLMAGLLCAQSLPLDSSTLFTGSGKCAICHVTGDGVFVTSEGEDISPASLWRSTMMANASKDPLWRAKVSAEVDAFPALQSVIEDKCTTCHSPLGRTEAHANGAESFSLQEAMADPLSLDGVSCTLCHQVRNDNWEGDASFSGGYSIDDSHTIYGPYESPTKNPMYNISGYTPEHAEQVHQSELCATCHTLFTPFVDNDGQVAGYFPEQTPYLEWENSYYPTLQTECQTCHMPEIGEAMKISILPPMSNVLRSPIWKHDFVGGNTFINQMLKTYKTELGVTADDSHFDQTLSKSFGMVMFNTINLEAEAQVINDTLKVMVNVENMAGHKFPTGFPSRRAWLHVAVTNRDDELVFESGTWDENGEIAGLDDPFEPHYDVITSQDQIQIYESVMSDVDDNVTYTLLRGAGYAKDNRLVPKGFTTEADGYEHIKICGNAENDDNFNKTETGEQGTGTDKVEYRVDVTDLGPDFSIKVDMLYQTVTPRFVQDLFTHDTDHVNTFENYYTAADKSPVYVGSIELDAHNTGVERSSKTIPTDFRIVGNYPNPFNPSTTLQYQLARDEHVSLIIYNARGHEIETLVNDHVSAGTHQVEFDASLLSSGVYFCVMKVNDKTMTPQKMLLVK